MSTLFTINKSTGSNLLKSCLRAASPGDTVLFLEDGVYHGVDSDVLSKIPEDIEVFCLKEDLIARGLMERLHERGSAASYRRFVELCTQHAKVISWF